MRPLRGLAQAWACTSRQARRRLQGAVQRGLMETRPGRGRGHTTQVRHVTSLRTLLLDTSQALGAAHRAADLLQLLQLPMPPELRREAAGALRAVLGWQQPQAGRDVFRTLWRGDLPPIDPHACLLTFSAHLVGQLGDTLLRHDPVTGDVQAHLAHHHDTPDGGRTWTLHLRKGVRFHHGAELTAQDVLHTFARFREGTPNYAFLLVDVRDVIALDPYTVQVKLDAPNLMFPLFLTSVALVILPHDVPFDPWRWVASGPFILADQRPDRLRFRANGDYFLGRPLLDEVEVYLLPQGADHVQLSVTGGPAPDGAAPYREVERGVNYLLALAGPGRPLEDVALRKAVLGLNDPVRMWTELGRDAENMLSASGFLFRQGTRPRPAAHPAVIPPLRPLKLLYLGKESFRHEQEARWLQQQARMIGVAIDIVPWTFAEIFAGQMAQDADLVLCNEVFAENDQLSLLAALHDTSLPFRRWPASVLLEIDGQLDRLLALEETERGHGIEALERWLVDEGWIAFLYHRVRTLHHHPQLNGLHLHSFGEVDWRTLWFRPDSGVVSSASMLVENEALKV